MTTPHTPPEWAFEFHGHRCPFMPIGYRMGRLAMEHLGVEREKDHGFYVVAELGEGHPQTCMMDGIQPATGSFNKTKCSSCGEYVFDRYIRTKDGAPVCIPCSGYEPAPQRR